MCCKFADFFAPILNKWCKKLDQRKITKLRAIFIDYRKIEITPTDVQSDMEQRHIKGLQDSSRFSEIKA